MFNQTGIISKEMFESLLPSPQRRQKGPYAIMECFQNIPCNPCNTSCKFGAVQVMQDINDTPQLDLDKCSGCGICVSICPGLACFVIDETYGADKASVKIPYELLPLPKEGDKVDALDRYGKPAGEAEVIKVQSNKALDKTNIITIAVAKELLYDVRNIRVRR